eukprot:7382074-Prymnesium_polylepis.3
MPQPIDLSLFNPGVTEPMVLAGEERSGTAADGGREGWARTTLASRRAVPCRVACRYDAHAPIKRLMSPFARRLGQAFLEEFNASDGVSLWVRVSTDDTNKQEIAEWIAAQVCAASGGPPAKSPFDRTVEQAAGEGEGEGEGEAGAAGGDAPSNGSIEATARQVDVPAMELRGEGSEGHIQAMPLSLSSEPPAGDAPGAQSADGANGNVASTAAGKGGGVPGKGGGSTAKGGRVSCGALGRAWRQMPRVVLIDEMIPQAQLPSLYRAADAFVLPSRGEGWGRPVVEAMAMGLPTIATNWSGTATFLHEAHAYPLPYELVPTG